MGGLGNQMFQYAAGRRLAIKHKTVLKLDVRFLLDRTPRENTTYRKYVLDVFNIQSNIASSSEINRFGPNDRNLFNYIKRKLKLTNVIKESNLHSYEDVLSAPDNSYLDGYWQSENYFKDVGVIIRRDFILKPELTNTNKEFAKEISSCDSVSLHIRRGDYVSNSKINKVHGVLQLEYYQKAVAKITSCLENPHFFIFSDDPKWVQENLDFEHTFKIITHNGAEKSYEDLRLMSLCKHNIIANSSFSWWGAWLNKNPYKIVAAPKNWFNTNERSTKDLIPEGWYQI